jgi:hypothetical protein
MAMTCDTHFKADTITQVTVPVRAQDAARLGGAGAVALPHALAPRCSRP